VEDDDDDDGDCFSAAAGLEPAMGSTGPRRASDAAAAASGQPSEQREKGAEAGVAPWAGCPRLLGRAEARPALNQRQPGPRRNRSREMPSAWRWESTTYP